MCTRSILQIFLVVLIRVLKLPCWFDAEISRGCGHKVRVGHFPFIGNGKAIALGEMDGFVKTVFDATTGELLSSHDWG